MPELVVGMSLPAVSPTGTGARSSCAFPVLPVCSPTDGEMVVFVFLPAFMN